MNERNWEYKGLQLSNKHNPYRFQVQNVDNEIVYNCEIYDSKNSDGVYSTNVVTGARYFKFTGVFYGSKSDREQAYKKLKEIIRTEDFPSFYNRGFHELRRTDKRGMDVKTQAKVYSPLKTKEGVAGTMTFEFTLLADNPLYYSQEEKIVYGGLGRIGGNVLPNVLPNTLGEYLVGIDVLNEGDKASPLFIQVEGLVHNPRITNSGSSQTMKFTKDTNFLIVDNRTKPFIVTDEGVNIKEYRTGQYIYLTPGRNRIVVASDEGVSHPVKITIKYNFTYE